MIAVKTVTDAITAKLKLIPGLVAIAGSAAFINANTDSKPPHRSTNEAVAAMQFPSMLLALVGISLGQRGGFQQWRYEYELFLAVEKPETAHEAFRIFIDSVPTGDTLRLMDTKIHNDFDPIEDPALVRSVSEDGVENWSIKFALTEIGG